MEETKYDFKVGEIVAIPYKYMFLSKSGQTKYCRFTGSRYVCIREDSNTCYGILVKFIGEYDSPLFMVKGGEPFCKDDKMQELESRTYYSYRFPSAAEVKEVLDILNGNEKLLDSFKQLSMPANTKDTFWVREVESKFPFRKLFRYYDPASDQVYTSTDKNTGHSRMAIVYFHKSRLMM